MLNIPLLTFIYLAIIDLQAHQRVSFKTEATIEITPTPYTFNSRVAQ